MIGNRQSLFLIVGDVGDRKVEALLQFPNVLAHPPPEFGIEVRKRLVEQQNLRFENKGASHGNALLLPAREFRRRAFLKA